MYDAPLAPLSTLGWSFAVLALLLAAGHAAVARRRRRVPAPHFGVTTVDAALTTGLVATLTGLATVLLAVLPVALGA